MSAIVIDGKKISEEIKLCVKAQADDFLKSHGRRVGLAVVRVGDDKASEIYVRNKIRACEKCNVRSIEYRLGAETTEAEVLGLVARLNSDETVDGILVQLPLPKHISERKVINAIDPRKDADGFHPSNMGALVLGEKPRFAPCTALGIIELIRSTGENISGKTAVVVGRSNIVGKPTAALLLSLDATVTVCHSKTCRLKEITRTADILVAAVGKAGIITADMVKPGAIVIDVGMNRTDNGLFGDVDFAAVKDVAGYITPVPGGVGPMTVAELLKNTVEGAADE